MPATQYIEVVTFGDVAQVLPDWSASEEARVMRKVDLALIPWLLLCYTALNIDRQNISAAIIMNAETPAQTMVYQLGLDGSKFNWALSAFFVGYVVLEVPSNLLITRFNPSRWIARVMTSWGVLVACMGAVRNFTGLVVVRTLVGCMEAGFSPGTALYLSFWYKKYEVSSRWAYMFGGASVVSSFGGVIAFVVANMDGIAGLAGWRWLFIIEGAASTIFGLLTIFILPDYPQTCKFLEQREKEMVIGRLPPTGPSFASGDMVPSEILGAFKDWKMYALSISLMLTLITVYAFSYFSPSMILALGFSSADSQLLTVPIALVAAVWILFINWSSERFHDKVFHGIACLLPPISGYFLLSYMQGQLPDWGRYGLLFLPTLTNGVIPLIVGLSTMTSKNASRTAVRSAFTVASGNLGGVIGGQIYRLDDAPLFLRGHFVNGVLLIPVIVLFVLAGSAIAREGDYAGRRANVAVFERSGLEYDPMKPNDIRRLPSARK
ncbi:MFS general substrate transporter [Gonapodya prolifera JEL478]|uniref:MFS general substrate transporter n=1 Tax=Gonapodya prolifera (strain JEL478) TaxID=1344416 RepID=A0A139B0L0_GONPJ|nr:MFS general substrate transporter [Gonapodya prolifera JEL478]|eukprot:KXS22532.1 MFS general substrate transporter [Gonapodya prolifera JEL478]